MLYRTEAGYFGTSETCYWQAGEALTIFEEDDQVWLEGTVQKDQFNEYYFTDGFLVVYLYEGLPVKTKQ